MKRDSVLEPPAAIGASRVALQRLPGDGVDRLRIAVLAPPWIPVPPPGYGGIERVVNLLCEALVIRGHEVTLFAAPGSRSLARVISPLEAAHPDEIGSSLCESDHVSCAWEHIDLAADRDEHSTSYTTTRVSPRWRWLIEWPLRSCTRSTACSPKRRDAIYQRHGHKARLVAISRSQPRARPAV